MAIRAFCSPESSPCFAFFSSTMALSCLPAAESSGPLGLPRPRWASEASNFFLCSALYLARLASEMDGQ